MNQLKLKNEKLLESELNYQKRINYLENENDSLKYEIQKMKLKTEKPKRSDSFYIHSEKQRDESVSKNIDMKITYPKKEMNHRDIKQKLQVNKRYLSRLFSVFF